MEDLVTNEVLMERLNNLIETNSREHAEIKEQVEKTNGSVANLKIWKGVMQGAVGVLTVIVIPLLFIFIRFWIGGK